jgi:hypothetical protein
LLEDEKAGQVVELKTGKGKMASFMQKFGRKILLDEPVVRRWNSLPLLWSCKVRLAETWISISMRIRKNMDENAWVSLSKLASTIHVRCCTQARGKEQSMGKPCEPGAKLWLGVGSVEPDDFFKISDKLMFLMKPSTRQCNEADPDGLLAWLHPCCELYDCLSCFPSIPIS